MQERVSHRARHAFVHFRHHDARPPRRRQRAIRAHAQADEAVLVRRAHLHERDVNRQLALEKPFNLAQTDRRVIATALRHRFANVAAQKQAVVPEVAGVFRPQVGQRAQCQHLAHFDVPQLGCASHQRFQQHDRDAAPLLHPDPIARVNQFDRALSAGNPLFIIR